MNKWVIGKLGTDKLLAFAFGTVFVVVILVMAIAFPNPSKDVARTFNVVLALAAAGVGAMLPGFIHVQGKIAKLSLRAGGALALFVVVFFFGGAVS